MSASTTVDVGGTCQLASTLPPTTGAIGSGGFVDAFRSGVLIGQTVDMLHSDTFCNVLTFGTLVTSGPLVLQVQTSDSVSSGTFTDPTSGLAQFPTYFQSGGLLYYGQSGDSLPAGINPGSGSAGFVSGVAMLSGFAVAAAFQRPGRYARVNVLSGFYAGSLQTSFLSQYKTTGSGGGYSPSPSSGGVNV